MYILYEIFLFLIFVLACLIGYRKIVSVINKNSVCYMKIVYLLIFLVV